jgi:hypothetical protein
MPSRNVLATDLIGNPWAVAVLPFQLSTLLMQVVCSPPTYLGDPVNSCKSLFAGLVLCADVVTASYQVCLPFFCQRQAA